MPLGGTRRAIASASSANVKATASGYFVRGGQPPFSCFPHAVPLATTSNRVSFPPRDSIDPAMEPSKPRPFVKPLEPGAASSWKLPESRPSERRTSSFRISSRAQPQAAPTFGVVRCHCSIRIRRVSGRLPFASASASSFRIQR